MRALVLLALLMLAAPSAAQTLYEDFEGSFPPVGWVVGDMAQTGLVWDANDSWGHDNWTGGSGSCAMISTDGNSTTYDCFLYSPLITVPDGGHFYARVNYQNYAGEDRLVAYVHVGMSDYEWQEITHDIGGFESLPGGWVDVDISMWAPNQIKVGFRYQDMVGDGDDWYCQVDDVIVGDESPVEPRSWGAIKAMYR